MKCKSIQNQPYRSPLSVFFIFVGSTISGFGMFALVVLVWVFFDTGSFAFPLSAMMKLISSMTIGLLMLWWGVRKSNWPERFLFLSIPFFAGLYLFFLMRLFQLAGARKGELLFLVMCLAYLAMAIPIILFYRRFARRLNRGAEGGGDSEESDD